MDPVLHRLALGYTLEIDPRADPSRVHDGVRLAYPMSQADAGQKAGPVGKTLRRRRDNVAKSGGPECGLGIGIRAIKDNLERGGHTGSSRVRREIRCYAGVAYQGRPGTGPPQAGLPQTSATDRTDRSDRSDRSELGKAHPRVFPTRASRFVINSSYMDATLGRSG